MIFAYNIDATFKTFLKNLSECTAEDVGAHEGVSSVYSTFFSTLFNSDCTRVHGCDGLWKLPSSFSRDGAHMLVEYKFGRNLKSKLELSKVLAQCVYYIHKMVESGEAVPKVVCVADENESVFLSGEVLWRIAGKSTDFSFSPSNAAADEKLLNCLFASSYIENLFVFNMDETCDLEGFVRTIANIAGAEEDDVLVEVTEHNIDKIWTCFRDIVFGSKKDGAANEQVSVFVHYITNHDDFLIDDEKGRFGLNGKSFKVADPKQFKAFRRHFGYVRSVKQKERLRATCDRFIEDMNRRMKGEFYTPTAFVDYAHRMIEKEFGENWKDEYVVWDCAWGTGNLTRDYKFKELYCSTLEQAELDIAKGVNPEATKFQYDFLNDDFEKLPEGLQKAFKEGKKILFLINPPYKGSTSNVTKEVKESRATSFSKVKVEMKEDNMGKSSQEMYAQFLYRICKLKETYKCNTNIALFCKPKFLTGTAFSNFRTKFLKHFNFCSGIIFNASHFSDVSAAWGITFNMWKSGETADKQNFLHSIVDMDKSNTLVANGTKTLYNIDGLKRGVELYKEIVVSRPLVKVCTLKNAIVLSAKNVQIRQDSLTEGFLGFMSSYNTVSQWTNYSYLFSSAQSAGNGVSVTKENYTQCTTCYSVTKIVTPDWLNDKDEMLYPNVDHPLYRQFCNDAVVFSTFHGVASSMRKVEQGGKLWDIKNEFFWMGRDEIMELADEAGFDELYNDAKESSERFVYGKLQTIDLSPEAAAVLQKAREIIEKSFPYRKEVHDSHPEYHLNAWDAGWYQVKKLVAELPHLKADMDEFKVLFKALGDKMRPMVYELGFLKK